MRRPPHRKIRQKSLASASLPRAPAVSRFRPRGFKRSRCSSITLPRLGEKAGLASLPPAFSPRVELLDLLVSVWLPREVDHPSTAARRARAHEKLRAAFWRGVGEATPVRRASRFSVSSNAGTGLRGLIAPTRPARSRARGRFISARSERTSEISSTIQRLRPPLASSNSVSRGQRASAACLTRSPRDP